MRTHDKIHHDAAAVLARALNTYAASLTTHTDRLVVESIDSRDLVEILANAGMIAYPAEGVLLDAADPIDVAVGIARDTLHDLLGDTTVAITATTSGTLNVRTTTDFELKAN